MMYWTMCIAICHQGPFYFYVHNNGLFPRLMTFLVSGSWPLTLYQVTGSILSGSYIQCLKVVGYSHNICTTTALACLAGRLLLYASGFVAGWWWSLPFSSGRMPHSTMNTSQHGRSFWLGTNSISSCSMTQASKWCLQHKDLTVR